MAVFELPITANGKMREQITIWSTKCLRTRSQKHRKQAAVKQIELMIKIRRRTRENGLAFVSEADSDIRHD